MLRSNKITRTPMARPIPIPHHPDSREGLICGPRKYPLLPVAANSKILKIKTPTFSHLLSPGNFLKEELVFR
jgi:hypothetical protein